MKSTLHTINMQIWQSVVAMFQTLARLMATSFSLRFYEVSIHVPFATKIEKSAEADQKHKEILSHYSDGG